MAVAHETVALLEEIAANAVAAQVVQLVDGWLLRAWPEAPFRRSNSVLPLRGDARGLEDRITLVEDFYRRRALPVRYQLSPAVSPRELEERLVARGYEVEVTSLVQTADASRMVAATAGASALEVTVCDAAAVDEAWLASHADAHGAEASGRSRVVAYGGLLGRVGPRGAAAVARLPDAGVVGAGFVIVERGWAGIFGMGTTPAARRRGVATAILHALARHAQASGATQLYLQVEQDNEPARALYAGAGFVPGYSYHYRSLDLRRA